MTEEVTITGVNGNSVSGLLSGPKNPKALLVLAHGAGAGMGHPFMAAVAGALEQREIATLRFQFPYMEEGKKRPDTPKIATATVAAAVAFASKARPKACLLAGGKSFGGRMTTTAASLGMIPKAHGLVLLGFPLHAPSKPSLERASHLKEVFLPALFLQGTRDTLCELSLIKRVVKGLPAGRLHVVEGGDHSFSLPKSLKKESSEVFDELAREIDAFWRQLG